MATRHLAAAMVAGLCVGGAAAAQTLSATGVEIEGRWVNEKSNLTLDISRCGDGWCGVQVKNDACAQTALRMAAKEEHEGTTVSFRGRLTLAEKAAPYAISATLYARDGAVRLRLMGNPGNELELWRRWYPLNELMARSGPPQCKPDAKVS
jgi:hypothetical protein